MSHASSARRAAAFGGGGLAGASAAFAGVIIAQARGVKRAIGPQKSVPPYQDGRYGRWPGTSIRLALLGDSVAAGLGADSSRDTIGAILAAQLAVDTHRTVSLTNHAVVGAQSRDLASQVARALHAAPHLAVIVIGANDVTHWVRPSLAAAQLGAAIAQLRAAGTGVIVGTCPNLGTVRPVGPPLKWVARTRSVNLAAAQTRAILASGGIPVSVGDLLGPEFEANAETMFAPDRFHPSAHGYRRLAAIFLPPARKWLTVAPTPLA